MSDLWEIVKFLNDVDLDFHAVACTNDHIAVLLPCNDLFWWGVADSEEVTIDDLPDLRKALYDLNETGLDGELFCDILWMVRKRKLRPQGACFSRYPYQLQELIIQSAPLRDVDLYNPYTENGKYEYRPPTNKTSEVD